MQRFHETVTLSIPPAGWGSRTRLTGPGLIPYRSRASEPKLGVLLLMQQQRQVRLAQTSSGRGAEIGLTVIDHKAHRNGPAHR